MPISAEELRELAARRESSSLDFKLTQYDWKPEGNLELAKDIMAIANALPPGSLPGYILIGVGTETDSTGRIVGIDPASHLDDACMQQKVSSLLNRNPTFSYYPVVVDALSIGVFEIHPGGRPFYPLKEKGNSHRLARFEALVRVGTSTDIASPDQIQSWLREDETQFRLQRIHEGLSRFLGFLVEATSGNPFHWSKHVIHCASLKPQMGTVLAMLTGIDEQTFQMHPLQIKAVIESAHEASPTLAALIPVAFQLSSDHGLIWLSINSSVSQLASLYPFTSETLERRTIRRGEDTFSLALYELLEQLPRFEEASRLS